MEKLTPATFIGKEGNGIISFGSGQPDLFPPREIYEMLPRFNRFKYGLILASSFSTNRTTSTESSRKINGGIVIIEHPPSWLWVKGEESSWQYYCKTVACLLLEWILHPPRDDYM